MLLVRLCLYICRLKCWTMGCVVFMFFHIPSFFLLEIWVPLSCTIYICFLGMLRGNFLVFWRFKVLGFLIYLITYLVRMYTNFQCAFYFFAKGVIFSWDNWSLKFVLIKWWIEWSSHWFFLWMWGREWIHLGLSFSFFVYNIWVRPLIFFSLHVRIYFAYDMTILGCDH